MSGRYARDKGARRERAIVRLLEMAGLAATKISRTGYTGADLAIPLIGRQLRCDVKSRGTGFRQLYTWLAKVDLLIAAADRQPPLVITSFALATQIARAAQNSRTSGSAPAQSGIPPHQKVETMSEETKKENLPVIAIGDDGFDDVDPNERLIQGPIARCVDGRVVRLWLAAGRCRHRHAAGGTS